MLPTAANSPHHPRFQITESNAHRHGDGVQIIAGADGCGRALKRPTASIDGPILEGERFAVLGDILGDQDHLGNMTSGAGTSRATLQMYQDRRHHREIMRQALARARDGASIPGE
jgi:polyribonucleotide nucleotidyltransferase